LYLSVITIMEIRFGIERLEAKGAVKKADLLRRWLSAAEIVYRSHVIPVAVEIAHRAGELLSQAVTDGARPTTEDALIAATADVKHLRLLSRNGKDMKALRVAWSDPLSSLPHGGSR